MFSNLHFSATFYGEKSEKSSVDCPHPDEAELTTKTISGKPAILTFSRIDQNTLRRQRVVFTLKVNQSLVLPLRLHPTGSTSSFAAQCLGSTWFANPEPEAPKLRGTWTHFCKKKKVCFADPQKSREVVPVRKKKKQSRLQSPLDVGKQLKVTQQHWKILKLTHNYWWCEKCDEGQSSVTATDQWASKYIGAACM